GRTMFASKLQNPLVDQLARPPCFAGSAKPRLKSRSPEPRSPHEAAQRIGIWPGHCASAGLRCGLQSNLIQTGHGRFRRLQGFDYAAQEIPVTSSPCWIVSETNMSLAIRWKEE